MQNAGIAALGLNWRYLAHEVRPENLREAILGARAMHYIGVNLTVPHKLLGFQMVDALDSSARKWGAVNTVRFEGLDGSGEWVGLSEFSDPPLKVRAQGFNTDADAIIRSLREDLGFQALGSRILLVGAGGAGRAAALRLAEEQPSEFYLVNRTRSKAEAMAEELKTRYPGANVRVGYPSGPVELLLNATSLGLKAGDGLPVDLEHFKLSSALAVYDMIYRPAETPLLREAKAAGCRVANGLGMLLFQGARALEIWSGREAPVQVMREALMRNIYA
jgi:shikimate dehydrogenase